MKRRLASSRGRAFMAALAVATALSQAPRAATPSSGILSGTGDRTVDRNRRRLGRSSRRGTHVR